MYVNDIIETINSLHRKLIKINKNILDNINKNNNINDITLMNDIFLKQIKIIEKLIIDWNKILEDKLLGKDGFHG